MEIGALIETVLQADEIDTALAKGRGGVLDLMAKYGYSWAKTQPGVAAALEACKIAETKGEDIDCDASAKGIIRQAANTVLTKANLWPPIDALIAVYKMVPEEIRAVIKATVATIRQAADLVKYVITKAPAWLAKQFVGALDFLVDPKKAVAALANVLLVTTGGAIIGTLEGLASGLGLPSSGAIPGVDIPGIPYI